MERPRLQCEARRGLLVRLSCWATWPCLQAGWQCLHKLRLPGLGAPPPPPQFVEGFVGVGAAYQHVLSSSKFCLAPFG